jgi:hypothetical protein
MSIVERAKNICLTPSTEWTVIDGESTPAGSLIAGYVVPLVAIGAIAGFIGGSIIGRSLPFIGTYRVGMVPGLVLAIFSFVMAVVSILILTVIINALAPTFGGTSNSSQAMKVAVYSYTPAWIAGVLNILPLLGVLAFFAALYGIYVMYLGLPRLMKCPADKALGYTAVVVICAIVLSVVVSAAGAVIGGLGMLGSGALAGLGSTGSTGSTGSSSEVQFDKNSTLGKLQDIGKKLEESGKKMERAEKSGDANAQAAAAAETLGTLFGGGKRVDPIGIDQLKPFIPETFAGLAKASSTAEKNGFAGIQVSKAEATYRDKDGGKSVTLQISDSGGVSGLVALAGWANVQEEKEDDNGFDRTRRQNGRLVHEKMSKTGSNEFGLVLGDRFMVSAKGDGVDLNDLKAGVSSLDLAKLESMKDVGVQK